MSASGGKISLAQIRRDPTARTPSYYAKSGIVRIDSNLIQELKKCAAEEGGVARVCLHASANDRHHDMVLVANRESNFQPHCHPHKDETIHVIEGRLGLIRYSSTGEILGTDILGPGELVRLPANHWHCTLPLSESVVYHESAPGPYVSGFANATPGWFSDGENFRQSSFDLFSQKDFE